MPVGSIAESGQGGDAADTTYEKKLFLERMSCLHRIDNDRCKRDLRT